MVLIAAVNFYDCPPIGDDWDDTGPMMDTHGNCHTILDTILDDRRLVSVVDLCSFGKILWDTRSQFAYKRARVLIAVVNEFTPGLGYISDTAIPIRALLHRFGVP